MTGIEPGTPGTEQRTQNPAEAAPREGVAGNQDPQRQDAREADIESRRGSADERMIDAEDEFARQRGEERDAAAEGGDSKAQAETADTESLGEGGEAGGDDESDDPHAECPLCGHPMGEHTIERSHGNAVLNCPAPHVPAPVSDEPLNEFGMIKRHKE